MKTHLLVLLLSALSLGAQTPPPPTATDGTNRIEALRRALRGSSTNAAERPALRLPAARTNRTPAGTVTNPLPATPSAPTLTQPVPASPGAVQTPATQQPATNAPLPTVPAAAVPTTPTTPAPTVPAAQPPTGVQPGAAPLAGAAALATGEEIIPAGGLINFASADIGQVLDIYSKLVNRTILRPSTLPAASIVLKTQTDLTKQEAIQALDAVLALNGISMIPVSEKFIKALPLNLANAAGAAVNTNEASQLPELGSYVTHIVQTKYIKPSELSPALSPFQSMATAVLAVDSSGILVLRDNAENVKRMLEMVERVDILVPSEWLSEVIPIKFAKAEDIASALNSLSSGGGGASIGQSRTGAGATTRGARTGQPNYPGQPGQPGQPMTTPGTPATGTPSGGGTFSDRLRNIIQRASASGDLEILGQTKIIADIRSNSLLIFAARQDMAMIKDIVNKLDVVLAQVLIETIIMDVSMDNSWALGISAAQTPRQFSGDFSGAGAMNMQRFTDLFNGSSGTTNAFSDLVGDGLRYFGKVDDDIFIQLQAAASDGRVNVIQKPRIQTSHATPASIFIGSTVPYVSSTYYGGGYAGGPSSSFQQLRVGIGLNVTPFINADGLVVMQIDETIDEISGSTAITGVGDVPNTTSRTLSAEVAVHDRETIILGGFIRNSQTKSRAGVPILMDIPLLGYLFRSTGEAKERKELIVLMRPTVLRTPELASAHVEVEKSRLPGVREAEREVDELERRAMEKDKRKGFQKPTPFTPEEKQSFGKPETTVEP